MFKKLLKFILVLFIIFMIALPFIAPGLGTWLTQAGFTNLASMVGSFASLSPWVTGAIGLGLSYMIAPGTTSEIVADVAEIATKVGEGVAGVVSTVGSAVLQNIWPWLVGIGAFLLLTDRNKEVTS